MVTPVGGDRSRRRLHGATVLVLLVLLWTSCVVYVRARGLYFFADDWVFLLLRDAHWPGLLEPYNGHWSTTLILATRGLLAVFGFGHYVPYAAVPVVCHVIGTLSMYVVLRRTDTRPWPAALATSVVGLGIGSSAVGLLWLAVTGFIGAVGFTTAGLALALVIQRAWLRLGLAWTAFVLASMCSAMAPVIMLWAGLVLWRTQGLRRAAPAVVPPGLVLMAWLAAYRGQVADAESGQVSLVERLRFIGAGLRAPWDSVVDLPGSGVAVLVLLAVVALVSTGSPRPRAVAIAGLGSVLVLFVLLARTRAGLGVGEATSPRYAYAALFLTAPALALLCQSVADRVRSVTKGPGRHRVALGGLGGVLVALAAINGFQNLDRVADNREFVAPDLASTLRAAVDLAASGEPVLTTYVSPTSPPLDVRRFAESDYLADRLADVRTTPLARVRAALALQTIADIGAVDLPAAVDITAMHVSSGSEADGEGCRGIVANRDGAFLQVAPAPGGGALALRFEGDARVRILAVDGSLMSEARTVRVAAGDLVHLGTVMPRASLRVILDKGAASLCGATLDTPARQPS